MQLTIAVFDDRVVSVEIDPEASLGTLKAILEAETSLPAATQLLKHNGQQLQDVGKSLSAQGVQPNDLIMLERTHPAQVRQPAGGSGAGRPQPAANPSAMNADGSAAHPELLMSHLRSNPAQMLQLPTAFRDAVAANDVPAFQRHLREMTAAQRSAREEEQRLQRLAEEDPFNEEVQRKLEEAIQRTNVAENFETAMEHNPEVFGSVVMLYVDMEVNGVRLKAFVDSGAQMTIMSKSCAERCGLLRLMDTRWQGMAVGVGTGKILGRIHMVPLKAGGQFFPVSITVLEQDSMEFLFGLDNLKRHQCCLDLKENLLRFGTTNTALPFLPEHEIPKKELHQGDADAQPTAGPPPQAVGPTPAPPPPQQQQRASAGTGAANLPAGWEDKVGRLTALGFSREQCEAALRSTDGNEDMAGSMLFTMME